MKKEIKIQLTSKILIVEGLKKEIEQFENKLWNVLRVEHSTEEITGIVEKPETHSSTILTSLFTSTWAMTEEQKQARIDLLNSIPSPCNAMETAKVLSTWFRENVKVVDNRRTVEAERERNAAYQEREKKQEQDRKESLRSFLSKFGKPSADGWFETVSIPKDQQAICLKLTYDNSDPMTDYFDRHCGIGVALLLDTIPEKSPQSELAATKAISKYPELVKLAYHWKTEKWSMGHGNYLITDNCVEIIQDDEETHHCRYEVTFDGKYGYSEIYAYRDFPGIQPVTAAATMTIDKVTVTENKEKQGIEVRFPAKPSEDVIQKLKNEGFRWSRWGGCWYVKAYGRTPESVKTQLAL